LQFALHAPDMALALALNIKTPPALRTAACSERARWQWQRPFIHHYQPFLLKGCADPNWRALRLMPFVLALAG